MNRSVTFRILDKGKLKIIRALYSENRFNIVPTFYSSDIDTMILVNTNDKVGFVINKDYESKEDTETINIRLLYMLLNLNIDKVELTDILNAYWNGFQATINVIKSMKNIEDSQKKYRIKQLEKLLIDNKYVKVPSKESFLESFKYIEVN